MPFSFTSWLKNNILGTGRNQPRSAARPLRTTRLNVELLEDRVQPAAITPLDSFITPLDSFGSNGANPVAAQMKAGTGHKVVTARGVVTRVLRADGKMVQTITGRKAFRSRVDVYDKGKGKLLTRKVVGRHGTVLKGHWEGGKWLEQTIGLPGIPLRTEVYDKAGQGRQLLTRDEMGVGGEWSRKGHWEGGRWVEQTTGLPGIPLLTEVYDKPGNGRRLLSRDVMAPEVATPQIQVSADGTVTVTAADGSEKVFQNLGKDWEMISDYQAVDSGWLKSIWGTDGTITRTLRNAKQGGDLLAQSVIADGKITVTAYGRAVYYWWYDEVYLSNNAKLEWVFSVDSDGVTPNFNDLLEYHVRIPGGYYNDYLKDKVGVGGGGFYKNGWNVSFPEGQSPLTYPTGILPDSLYGKAKPLQTFDDPPGVNVIVVYDDPEKGYALAVWNTAHTQSLTFVYDGENENYLLEQTYGREQGGQWVETTTHSQDFNIRTDYYDTRGGKLVSREITLTVNGPDGYSEVIFNGGWHQDGKWVETATNYLGFQSVAVVYYEPSDGNPLMSGDAIQRYGVLSDGRWAVDTFDEEFEGVDQRDVSAEKGGAIQETYSSVAAFQIERYSPDPNVTHDVLLYRDIESPGDPASNPPYGLFEYECHYIKPFFFDSNWPDRLTTHYRWGGTLSDDGTWHYRDGYEVGEMPGLPGDWFEKDASPNGPTPLGWSPSSILPPHNNVDLFWDKT